MDEQQQVPYYETWEQYKQKMNALSLEFAQHYPDWATWPSVQALGGDPSNGPDWTHEPTLAVLAWRASKYMGWLHVTAFGYSFTHDVGWGVTYTGSGSTREEAVLLSLVRKFREE